MEEEVEEFEEGNWVDGRTTVSPACGWISNQDLGVEASVRRGGGVGGGDGGGGGGGGVGGGGAYESVSM